MNYILKISFILLICFGCQVKPESEIHTKDITSEKLDWKDVKKNALESRNKAKSNDTDSFKHEDSLFSVQINQKLIRNSKTCFTAYFTSDTTLRIIIEELITTEWKTIFNQELGVLKECFSFDYMEFVDYTGDNNNEIILPDCMSRNASYYCLIYNPEIQKYKLSNKILTDPYFDKSRNSIITVHTGGIGNFILHEYVIKNYSFIERNYIESSLEYHGSHEESIQHITMFSSEDEPSSPIDSIAVIGFDNIIDANYILDKYR